jgi:hypothetical protein
LTIYPHAVTPNDLIKNGIRARAINDEALSRRSFSAALELARAEYNRRQKIDGYSSSKTDAAWKLFMKARAFDISPSRAIEIYGEMT